MNKLQMAMILAVPIVLVIAVMAYLPTLMAGEQHKHLEAARTTHSKYPISILLPLGWSAKESHDNIIPIDTWILSPTGSNLFDHSVPRIILMIDWLPRKPRQSAGFPGELYGDEKKISIIFAGKPAKATFSDTGGLLLADLEQNGLFIAVKSMFEQPDQHVVHQILRDINLPPYREISSYPFFASSERAAIIRTGIARISVGMSIADVVAVVGEPDEIRPWYEPKYKHPKIIGYSYWYIVQRLVKNGNANQKQESLLRVSFTLNNKVAKIDSWGL